ncbi:MAG TPA: hypothetical protein ENI23_03685 [bacterium]|nr:hypothetical protein [bacterium]
MPIYKPQLSPRLNPYGALKDITPEGFEAAFVESKGGDPQSPPFNYRIKIQGETRIFAYFGDTGFPKRFFFYFTDDGGESWENNQFEFNFDILVDEAIVESGYFSNELFLTAPRFVNPTRVFIDTYVSGNFGENWSFLWSLEESGYEIGDIRIFPVGGDIIQVANVGKLSGGGPNAKMVAWRNSEQILNEEIPGTVNLFGIGNSVYKSKIEIGFFLADQSSIFGGSLLYRVDKNGVTKVSTLPIGNVFPVPPGEERPLPSQMWWLEKKGVIYIPTFPSSGARIYRSWDEGKTWEEERGGIRIEIPGLTHLGKRSIFKELITEDHFRSEGYLTDITPATLYGDVLDAYSDGIEWHLGFERRLSRRLSRFYLLELMNP